MSNIPAPSTHDLAAALVYKVPDTIMKQYAAYLDHLREELKLIHEAEDSQPNKEPEIILPWDKKRWVSSRIQLLEELLAEIPWGERCLKDLSSSLLENKNEFISNQSSTETPRYLCISNGFEMWCLDLKQSNTPFVSTPPVVKFTELPDKCLPVSAGLFNLGSGAYMTGGTQLSCDSPFQPHTGCLRGMELYQFLGQLCVDGVVASSRDTYQLSLDGDDDTAASLSRCKCNTIGQLLSPKFWPIVEKIDGQVHVIDSPIPHLFEPGRIFSHEVLYPGSYSWENIPTFDFNSCITSHLVVGSRIYAVADKEYLIFDSNTKQWEATPRNGGGIWDDPFTVKQVWDILDVGMARCVGEFSSSLHVIVAVSKNWRSPNGNDSNGMVAVAYLVTLTGRVLCFQFLTHFFEEPLPLSSMCKGTMINVDEKGKMWCTVVEGKSENCENSFLYINTFSVGMLTDAAASKVRQLELEAEGREGGLPVEEEFVGVGVKDKYIYTTAAFANEGDRAYFPRLQACFL